MQIEPTEFKLLIKEKYKNQTLAVAWHFVAFSGFQSHQRKISFKDVSGVFCPVNIDFGGMFIVKCVYPLVAQLDNAADSDSEERGFESLRAGQNNTIHTNV